jgi:aminoglycoside phosphotransferase (APT) family kinase protein
VDDYSYPEPLDGGWSGETFRASAGGEPVVVRIYRPGRRPEDAAEVDAAVLRLVRGLVPVPEVLEVRRALGREPGLLVTTYLPGERGDLLLDRLGEQGQAAVGARLGALAADLGGMPQLDHGPFLDARLTVGRDDVDGLPDLLERRLPELGHLTPDEIEGLRDVAADAQTRLDAVTRSCLVHGDLTPANLLLDPETLELTGVVDWERAHAGNPYVDLGALLRDDPHPAYAEALVAAYVERRGGTPAETLELARAADLAALVELATRRGRDPVATAADDRLRAVARSA